MIGTRDRIVAATNELFRRNGFNGTSLKDVTAASGATTGSLYHFFPGGKTDLARAVLLDTGATYQALFELIADEAADPAGAVAAFFDGAAEVLEQSDYIDPCPIGSVAREVASTNDVLRDASAVVFDGWVASAADRFAAAGVAADRAVGLATTVVAALEGGFVLARTHRDGDRLRTIGRHLAALVADAVTASATVGG